MTYEIRNLRNVVSNTGKREEYVNVMTFQGAFYATLYEWMDQRVLSSAYIH